MTDALFVYDRQLDSHYIRLLRVDSQLVVSNDKSLLSCTLETYDRADCPAYNALSYAWHEPLSSNNGDYSLLLNGCNVAVTTNLHLALLQYTQYLETADSAYWWIDALCIDQANREEQTVQVSIMHQIYRSATIVLVWLGADINNETYIVREFLRALLAKFVDLDLSNEGQKYEFDFLKGNNDQDFIDAGLPPLSSPIWRSVAAFWDRAWFSRTWVGQEVALAPALEFWCGSVQFTASELEEASRFHVFSGLGEVLMTIRSREQLAKKVIHTRRVGCSAVRIGMMRKWAQGVPYNDPEDDQQATLRLTGYTRDDEPALLQKFARQLFLARRDDASDARDKVFALLVFFKQVAESYGVEEVGLDIDYNMPLGEVYQSATAWVMLNSGCLGILSILNPDRALSDCINDCSWIPDYTSPQPQPLRMFVPPKDFHGAFELLDTELGFYISGYDLYVSGKHIGNIADIGDSYHSMLTNGCFEMSARCLLQCPSKMLKHNNLPRLEVWRKTLSGQSAHEVDLDPNDSRQSFHHFFAFYTMRAMAREYSEGRIRRARDLLSRMASFELLAETDTTVPRMLPDWAFWQRLGGNAEKQQEVLAGRQRFKLIEVSQRRLFRLKSPSGSYLCYGPEVVEEEDEVWIVARSAMPLVLRKRESLPGTYAVIGEAFMIDYKDVVKEHEEVQWKKLKLH